MYICSLISSCRLLRHANCLIISCPACEMIKDRATYLCCNIRSITLPSKLKHIDFNFVHVYVLFWYRHSLFILSYAGFFFLFLNFILSRLTLDTFCLGAMQRAWERGWVRCCVAPWETWNSTDFIFYLSTLHF